MKKIKVIIESDVYIEDDTSLDDFYKFVDNYNINFMTDLACRSEVVSIGYSPKEDM
jgi:hypothetical protein